MCNSFNKKFLDEAAKLMKNNEYILNIMKTPEDLKKLKAFEEFLTNRKIKNFMTFG